MGVLRLSTVCPDLDDALSSASADHCIQAGWAAAQWAIHQTGLSHPAISAAQIGGPTDAIAELVNALGDQYFELQELCDAGECSKEEVLAAFGRARAANALEFAVRGEAAEAQGQRTLWASWVDWRAA
jgi:hypothetical protein